MFITVGPIWNFNWIEMANQASNKETGRWRIRRQIDANGKKNGVTFSIAWKPTAHLWYTFQQCILIVQFRWVTAAIATARTPWNNDVCWLSPSILDISTVVDAPSRITGCFWRQCIWMWDDGSVSFWHLYWPELVVVVIDVVFDDGLQLELFDE